MVLKTDEFEEKVLNAKGLIVLDFWATWCGPCQMLSPLLEEVEKEKADVLTVYKVNVDEEGALAATFGIDAIPTLLWFRDGKLISRDVGFLTKEQLLQHAERNAER